MNKVRGGLIALKEKKKDPIMERRKEFIYLMSHPAHFPGEWFCTVLVIC